MGCCAPDFGNGTWGSAAALYGAVYVILGLGLPAVLVTVCNLRVLGIARYHRHRIASAIYEVTLSAQVTITHQRNPFFVPTVTAPSAGGPPRFHSAASTVRTDVFFSPFSFPGDFEGTLRVTHTCVYKASEKIYFFFFYYCSVTRRFLRSIGGRVDFFLRQTSSGQFIGSCQVIRFKLIRLINGAP